MELTTIFWYGLLHAFAPDHLSAIADFSIGKDRQKTLLVTFLFAIGHGVMLFIFAKIAHLNIVDNEQLQYADTIAATIIILMGAYMIFMVISNRVHIKMHKHKQEEHVHIWFGTEHEHNQKSNFSALSVGALMGIGGVRGVLLVLGTTHDVGLDVIVSFIAGVSIVFFVLGFLISIFNTNFLNNKKNLKVSVFSIGGISMLVGINMLGVI